MSRYKESYSDVPGGDFELIPEAKYPVRVVSADVRPSKSSGMDTWCLDLEIEGPKYAGRKLWLYISMKPEAVGVRKGAMTALGLDTSQMVNYDLIDDVIDRKALAEVYHDEYQGEKRAKVRRLRSLGKSFSEENVIDLEEKDLPF